MFSCSVHIGALCGNSKLQLWWHGLFQWLQCPVTFSMWTGKTWWPPWGQDVSWDTRVGWTQWKILRSTVGFPTCSGLSSCYESPWWSRWPWWHWSLKEIRIKADLKQTAWCIDERQCSLYSWKKQYWNRDVFLQSSGLLQESGEHLWGTGTTPLVEDF